MVFTVTSPTQELKPGNYIEELIQVHTSYQVIPSPLLINYDIEPILLSALPYTKYHLDYSETNCSTSLFPSSWLSKAPLRATTSVDIYSTTSGWLE